MMVQYGSTVVTSTLIVVACDGPLLCGRNTIEAFRKAGVSFWDTATTSSVKVVRDNEMTPLLDEFSDLFENKLGCCKGPLSSYTLTKEPAHVSVRHVQCRMPCAPKFRPRSIVWYKTECFRQ